MDGTLKTALDEALERLGRWEQPAANRCVVSLVTLLEETTNQKRWVERALVEECGQILVAHELDRFVSSGSAGEFSARGAVLKEDAFPRTAQFLFAWQTLQPLFGFSLCLNRGDVKTLLRKPSSQDLPPRG